MQRRRPAQHLRDRRAELHGGFGQRDDVHRDLGEPVHTRQVHDLGVGRRPSSAATFTASYTASGFTVDAHDRN